jgi:hypothetical protein
VNLDPRGVASQVEVAHERRRIERAGIDHLARSEYAQLHLRIALREVGEPRHEPALRKHRGRGDEKIGLPAARAQELHRRGERIESLAQPRQAGTRGVGELHAASRAAEQFHAEVFLEALDLVAYRGLGDRELVRGLLERQVPRGGFKDAQRVERRQAINHAK